MNVGEVRLRGSGCVCSIALRGGAEVGAAFGLGGQRSWRVERGVQDHFLELSQILPLLARR